MKQIKRILCPVDLSEDSLAAVDLATRLARDNQGEILFLHVALPILPSEKLFAEQEVKDAEEADKLKRYYASAPSGALDIDASVRLYEAKGCRYSPPTSYPRSVIILAPTFRCFLSADVSRQG